MEAALYVLKTVVRSLGGVRAAIFLALLLLTLAGAKYWMHRAEKAEHAVKVCEVARQVQIALWKGEIDRITRDLADAKAAGSRAIMAKVEAEKAAAKKLAQERKKWARILGKPENKDWAEASIPPDVLEGLQ